MSSRAEFSLRSRPDVAPSRCSHSNRDGFPERFPTVYASCAGPVSTPCTCPSRWRRPHTPSHGRRTH
jgi:hypothetical protein